MIFLKNIVSVALMLVASLCVNISYAQDANVNGTEKKTTDSLMLAMYKSFPVFSEITTITDNPTPASFTSATPSKSVSTTTSNRTIANINAKLPAKLYTTWNNKDIKLSSDRTFDKNTTYILPLVNETDHKFVIPYKGKVISPFGYRGKRVHAGTDIKLALNDEVYAAFDGEVRMAKKYSGYGNLVVIRHKNGLETCYGHLNKLEVKINQEVKAGDLIGLGGRTGRATTTHLHFETRFLGDAFNSAKLIDYNNYCLKSDTLVIDKNTFIKSKNFKYKKNKKGKRIKVYYEDPSNEENTPVNSNTTIVYQEEGELETTIASEETETVKEPIAKAKNKEKEIEKVKTNTKTKDKVKKEKEKTKTDKAKKPNFYKVRSGDTLSEIARKNGTTVKDLCKINKIKEDAVLSLDKKLKLK